MRAPERGLKLQRLIDDEGLDAAIVSLDVTENEVVGRVVNGILQREGRLDVVVNNAALGIGISSCVFGTTDIRCSDK
jgi:NAD(P)-dependent dehydrogenase (short-subunit alcohol dehydrogenase family)